MSEIAVVLVRGTITFKQKVKDTLKMLNLHKKNFCVLLPDTPDYRGMIKKVKDLITWGPIDEETKKILEKRKDKDKKFFRLAPPKKGFGRKGVKVPFAKGGALGDRKEKINDLIQRMI